MLNGLAVVVERCLGSSSFRQQRTEPFDDVGLGSSEGRGEKSEGGAGLVLAINAWLSLRVHGRWGAAGAGAAAAGAGVVARVRSTGSETGGAVLTAGLPTHARAQARFPIPRVCLARVTAT